MNAEIQAWYEKYKQQQQELLNQAKIEGSKVGHKAGLKIGHREGHKEGHKEGRKEGQIRSLFAVLRARGLGVSEADQERILAEKDLDRLELWHQRAIFANSVQEVLE